MKFRHKGYFFADLASVNLISTLLNQNHFYMHFSSLSLWGAMKKKPLTTLKNAHGSQGSEVSKGTSPGQVEENWITAVAALHNTDLVASG